MLLQTNSYIVPKEKRAEHARLLQRFRQTLRSLGCENFEVYEQVGPHWSGGQTSGRFVQIMRFRDRRHQQEVHAAEEADAAARQLIAEFCDLINFPYQQQQGLFASGYYQGVLSGPREAPETSADPSADPPDMSSANGHMPVKPAYRPQEAVRPEPKRPIPAQAMTDAPEAAVAQTPAEVIEPDWVEPDSLATDIGAQDAGAGFNLAGDTIDEDPDGEDEEVEINLYLDDEAEEEPGPPGRR